jgi:hypothetical protein
VSFLTRVRQWCICISVHKWLKAPALPNSNPERNLNFSSKSMKNGTKCLCHDVRNACLPHAAPNWISVSSFSASSFASSLSSSFSANQQRPIHKYQKHQCQLSRTRFPTSPDVVPLRVIWRELLEPRCLHNINPLRKLLLKEKNAFHRSS